MSSLPSYDDALASMLAHAPRLGVERVALPDALGRTLREGVHADRDQPPFDRSAMDGYAVRAADLSPAARLAVDGSVAAGGAAISFETPLRPGAARRIATGAPLPTGADAVIPVEQSMAEPAPAGEEERVRFLIDAARPWQNVHRRASDAARGDGVLATGIRLAPHHLGIAAAVGAATLAVAERPRIALLTTGDEVRPFDTPTDALGPQGIRNSNGPMLRAFLAALGVPLLHHEHVPDDPERTLAAAREALSRSHVVVTNGGVSVGERDYLPWAWKHLGLTTVLHGVAIQPGKPVFVARDDCKLVLGLPGNPVSVLCTAHLFVWPLLRHMAVHGSPAGEAAALPWRAARLAEGSKASAKREVFRAARLQPHGDASVVPWHGSGDLMHTAASDGLVRLPLREEVEGGTVVPFLPWVGA